jgi:L-fuculose-phosphate aldolase
MATMPSRSPALPSDEALLRESLVAAGRRLGARGLISAGEGNLSVRIGAGQILISPSGRRKDELAAADMLVVPVRSPHGGGLGAASGEAGDVPRPSSDVAIHRAIYEARPDAVAVVHAHLPASMALTLAGEVPDPAALPETALLLPALPFVPFATAGSAELAGAVAAALATGPEPRAGAALLERHGAVALGATLDQAVDRLELVEVLCRTWRDALLVRAAVGGAGERAILRPASHGSGTTDPASPRRDV